jgi:hypothetical protein
MLRLPSATPRANSGWGGDDGRQGQVHPRALMSAIMVRMVTLIATFPNLGLPPDFLVQWGKAYAVGWPVAATTA